VSRRIDRVLELLESGDVREIDGASENAGSFYDRPAESEEAGVGWSILAGRIVQAYNRGSFIAAIIYGRQGAGKSVYAIKVAYDALRRLGFLKPHHSTREVYKHYMIFSAYQLLHRARQADAHNRIPLLIWDDAGVHGGSYLFFTDPHLAKAIADTFRVIRTRVSAMLFTTPSPRDLLKPLRSYDTLIVYVHEIDDLWSRAHIYQMRLLPSGDARIWKLAMEDFRRRLRTYDDYIKIRDRYVDQALDALERLLEEKMLERMARMRKLLEKAGVKSGEA
jgi:hypothetical protein